MGGAWGARGGWGGRGARGAWAVCSQHPAQHLTEEWATDWLPRWGAGGPEHLCSHLFGARFSLCSQCLPGSVTGDGGWGGAAAWREGAWLEVRWAQCKGPTGLTCSLRSHHYSSVIKTPSPACVLALPGPPGAFVSLSKALTGSGRVGAPGREGGLRHTKPPAPGPWPWRLLCQDASLEPLPGCPPWGLARARLGGHPLSLAQDRSTLAAPHGHPRAVPRPWEGGEPPTLLDSSCSAAGC